jgi:hypothetical protein
VGSPVLEGLIGGCSEATSHQGCLSRLLMPHASDEPQHHQTRFASPPGKQSQTSTLGAGKSCGLLLDAPSHSFGHIFNSDCVPEPWELGSNPTAPGSRCDGLGLSAAYCVRSGVSHKHSCSPTAHISSRRPPPKTPRTLCLRALKMAHLHRPRIPPPRG